MYAAYFGLSRRPFASVPQVDQYVPATAIDAARGTLARCIERGEGVGMVVGPSGTGKTLLCQLLAEQFKETFKVAHLLSGRLGTRRALLQAILYELGRPYRGMDEGELRLALVDHLTLSEDCPQGMVLLVDEAHSLPLRSLEEIRTLTNFGRDGQPRVRLVLAGGSVLEERFASPKLDSFSQRIVRRCYLEALSRVETQDYVHVQIQCAGGPGEQIFPQQTCQSIYQATDGVPRLINQVCDHSLLSAYAAGCKQIEPAHVEEAWADLQQLPTPWNGESQDDSGREGVIEFGALEDQPDETEQPVDAGQADAEGPDTVPALRITPDAEEADLEGPEPGKQLERIEQMLAGVEEDFRPAGSIGPEVELVFDEPGDPLEEKFEHEEVVDDRYLPPAPPEKDPTLRDSGLPRPDRDQAGDDLDAGADEPVEAAEADETIAVVAADNYQEAASARTCPIAAVRRREYSRLFAALRRR